MLGSRLELADDTPDEIATEEEERAEHRDVGHRQDGADEQTHATQAVETLVEEAAAISEETSAEAETVAAFEEQTTATTEVAQSANDLAGRAAHLSEALDRFETEVPDDGGPEEVSVSDITAPEPSAKD